MTSRPRPGPTGALVELDGSSGEGGGQILRSALTLSLLTGRAFRISQIRANRDKPGLRPQHLAAVEAAALLGNAEVQGASVGSRTLTFRPGDYQPRDLTISIGTAGATALVLQTLFLPLALRAKQPVRLVLNGGTFNLKAPSYPFLDSTWRPYMNTLGLPVAVSMPRAGFYPQGGGRLEAWIEPVADSGPQPLVLLDRGPLRRISGVAGVCRLQGRGIADRMRDQATAHLNALGIDVPIEIEPVDWSGPAPGAAISLVVEHEHVSSTFVGLGARGKPAEVVADEAVAELFDYLEAPGAGAVDHHSADQLLLPLAFAEERSVYNVSAVTEHLRTNALTIGAFLERSIRIEDPKADQPGRVIVGS